jgi:hypothetical protein
MFLLSVLVEPKAAETVASHLAEFAVATMVMFLKACCEQNQAATCRSRLVTGESDLSVLEG